MESRVELLEQFLVGGRQSTQHNRKTNLENRVQNVQKALEAIEGQFPAIVALKSSAQEMRKRSAIENVDLLHANAERVNALAKEMEIVKELMDGNSVEQKAMELDHLVEKEARLFAAAAERKMIHEELVELLQSYSLWVDGVSEIFAARVQ